MTIGEGGVVEEIVEEELPQVTVAGGRVSVCVVCVLTRALPYRLACSAHLLKSLPKRALPMLPQLGCTGPSCRSASQCPLPRFAVLSPSPLQRLRDGDHLLPGRQWVLLVEDARGIGATADSVQIMLLKVTQAMAARCVVRHIVESRSKEKLCMLAAQWVASVADAPFKSRVDVIDVHGKHMHGNVSYDAKAGPRSAWKATLYSMPGFSEMAVEPLAQRFPTLRAFMQHARDVGQQRAIAELAGAQLVFHSPAVNMHVTRMYDYP